MRIGIARDKAFGFYYPDDLAALRAAGAELLPFDTLHDARLPALDGLFIGGGFPEVFMTELQANASLRADIAAAIDAGLPAYAECGGLMYLARSLHLAGPQLPHGRRDPGDVTMHARAGGPRLRAAGADRRPSLAGAYAPCAGTLLAHEFHYSSLDNLPPGQRFAYRVERGHGIDGMHDGLLHRNLLASLRPSAQRGGNRLAGALRRLRARARHAATLARRGAVERELAMAC